MKHICGWRGDPVNMEKLKEYFLKCKSKNKSCIVKNYKEMCKLLGEKERGGNSKQAWLKRWEGNFSFKRRKNSYIITEIFEEEKQPAPTLKNFKGSEHFKIPLENKYSKGVYIIQSGNKVYIGSTYESFRERFKNHYKKENLMHHTYDLLHEPDAEFKILYLAKDTDTEETISLLIYQLLYLNN